MIDGRKTRDGSAIKTFTCESCGGEFRRYQSQLKGRKRHFCSVACRSSHAKVKLDCKRCGQAFELHKCDLKAGAAGTWCSPACRHAEGILDRFCEHCGKAFETPKSRVLVGKGRYCSFGCWNEANPAKGGSVERECETCGATFWVNPFVVKDGRGRFCSRPCAMRGENNPQWTGGHTVEYPPEWNDELRRQIRNRDGRKCVICGQRRELDVHHIDYDKQNCDPSNLVTLCHPHHSSTNFNRDYWLAYFKEPADG